VSSAGRSDWSSASRISSVETPMIPQQQRTAELEVLPLADVNRAQLREAGAIEQPPEVAGRRQRLSFE